MVTSFFLISIARVAATNTSTVTAMHPLPHQYRHQHHPTALYQIHIAKATTDGYHSRNTSPNVLWPRSCEMRPVLGLHRWEQFIVQLPAVSLLSFPSLPHGPCDPASCALPLAAVCVHTPTCAHTHTLILLKLKFQKQPPLLIFKTLKASFSFMSVLSACKSVHHVCER